MKTKDSDVVLVVDDSPDTVGMLNSILSEAGYTVLVSLNGEQAISIANQMKPDIILLDAILPPTDGFSVCTNLKNNEDLAGIPVIFMTGLSEIEHIEKALAVGGVDYISKPVHASVLLARMQVHLTNARLMASARAALDYAGQFTLATDDEGNIVWATPQAQSLLAVADSDNDRVAALLKDSIRRLLVSDSSAPKTVNLDFLNTKLAIEMVGGLGGAEYLFSLKSVEAADHVLLFQQHFDLTEREAEVLMWLAQGKTNREIAQILSMSPRTVNKHLEQVFKKLAVENRTTAAAIAIRLIVSPRLPQHSL